MEGQPQCPLIFLRRGSGEGKADLYFVEPSDRTYESGSKLCQGRFKLDIKKHFLKERLVKHWNRFPREVFYVPHLSVFKEHLDSALKNILQLLNNPEVIK